MDITIRDKHRRLLGRVSMPPGGAPDASYRDETTGQAAPFQWDGALDDAGRLRTCPICNCRDIFRRRDFPQRVGLGLVLLAAIGSVFLFARGLVLWSLTVLAAMFVVDALIYIFTRECLVCYRCRSEFRATPIDREVHEPWDLAIGEKYRPARLTADGAAGS